MKLDKKYSLSWEEDWKRAKDFLKAAENNFNIDDYKTAANRAYFSAERAIIAALKFNSLPVSKNHKNIWTYSKLLVLKIDIFSLLRELYDMRLQADYGNVSNIIELSKDNLNMQLSKVRDLLKEINDKYKLE